MQVKEKQPAINNGIFQHTVYNDTLNNVTLNIGFNVMRYDYTDLKRLFYPFSAGKIIIDSVPSEWDGKKEYTYVIYFETYYKTRYLLDYLKTLCVILNENAISFRYDTSYYLLFHPYYNGVKYNFDRSLFKELDKKYIDIFYNNN